ncbi:MAG: carboxypeptidase regulatory-like domain-containing protein [Ardenticatenaceae bacterium]|nr:carboxypeptidase regulatory-like domain-containing protein [Ardenticatenaceae bacterium]
MQKQRGIWGITAVIVLAAVLFWVSSGVTRAEEGAGRLPSPGICEELGKPDSIFTGMPRTWLQNLCGETAVQADRDAAGQTAVIQQALAPDVPVNDPALDGGLAAVQSTTTTALNPTTGTVCAAYIDGYHGQVENKGYVGFSRSTDGGASFDDRTNIDASVLNYGNPSLVWRESDGNFYLSALLGGEDGVGVWRSADDCLTFVFVTALDTRLEYGVDDMSILAVDNAVGSAYYGRLYLVWYGEFDKIQFSASDDGLTWQGRTTISSGLDYNYVDKTPWATVGPDGGLFVVWNKNTFPWGSDWTFSIEGLYSSDGGATFAPISSPLTDAVMPRDANTTCGYNQPGLLGGIGYYPAPPQIVVGQDGVLHVVYAYDPDGYDNGDVVDVFYRRSLDNGATWEPEIRLNDDATLTDQFFPTVSVNENGRVVASWYDRRLDPANNYLFAYFFRTSLDNGQTWDSSQQISDAQSPVFADPTIGECYHGFYDQQFQDADSAYIFWSDNRHLTNAVQDPDVFFEKVTYPADFVISATPAEQAVCSSDSAAYTVNLASVSGFSSSVTLGVNGAPGGANAAFSPNPLVPTGDSTLTLSNLGAAAGTYGLEITATDGSTTHNTAVSLTVSSTTPAGVALTSPSDGAVNVPALPTFSWEAATGAVDYTLEIATDGGFGNVVYSETTTAVSLSPTLYLTSGTPYYWRVTAHNGCGSSVSSAASFTTAVSPAILLVDDDGDAPDVRAYYTDALDALSEAYDIWDTTAAGQPSEADFAAYDLVIWFSGGNYNAGPTAVTENTLSRWLPQDNCLFLSNPSSLNTITAFRSRFLGLRSFASPYPEYLSVQGDWVVYGGLGPYSLSYPYYPSLRSVIPNSNGRSAFVEGSTIAAATVNDAAFRSTFLGFPLEAVDQAGREEVLGTAVAWCRNGVSYGTLSGVVTDGDYATPIKNATIAADNGSQLVSFQSDAAGAYSGDLRSGAYTITVSALNYADYSTQVTINDAAVTPLDVNLFGGSLSYAPPAIEDTLALSDVTTHTVTLSASGPLPVDVGLTPYTTLADRIYGIYASYAPEPEIAYFDRQNPTTLTSLGAFNKGGSVGGDFFGDDFSVVYALANMGDSDATNDELVTIDTTSGAVTVIGVLPPPPGWEQYSAMGYDPTTAQMYVVSSYVDFFSTGGKSLFTIDVTTGQTTLLGPILSPMQMEIGAIAFDEQGVLYVHDMNNQQLVRIDKTTRVATTIGTVEPFTQINSGMDWDPVTKQMYITTWDATNGGQLHTLDLSTGATTLVEALGSAVPARPEGTAFTWIAFAAAPLPWATAVPDQVTIPANGSVNVDIALDTRGLSAPGDYTGAVAFSGSFVNVAASQPLTMHVTCADCGVLDGAIEDAWFNTPVKAQITLTSTNGMAIELVGVDAYAVTVPAGEYTLTASAPGYLPTTMGVTAVTNLTTTTNIALTPEAGFLEYSPEAIQVAAQVGDLLTRTVTVSNTGTTSVTFRVRLDGYDVPVSVRNAALAAINGQKEGNAADVIAPITAYGVIGEGVGGSLGWFNLDTPGNVSVSGQHIEHGSLRGGDFWANDFSKLYAFEESKLITLETATGAKEIIGALPGISTYTTYAGMAYDSVTEQMYILHAYECYLGQTLYTVDVHTAENDAGVPITGGGCLDSLTFSDSGVLYSIDLDNDALVTIDPQTGQVTIVGGLGFSANSFSQGLAWDSATNQLYYLATSVDSFPFVQNLYRIDTATGQAEYLDNLGYFSMMGMTIASEAAQWVSVPGAAMTVPAGAQATFDVVFDLRSLSRPGEYASEMVFEGDFINNPPAMPVNLTAVCTDCGVLDGVIKEAGTAVSLPATLRISGPNGFEQIRYNADSYNLTVQPGEYTFRVSRSGFIGQVETVTAVANDVVTTDFSLVTAVSDITLEPAELNETLPVGATITHSFTISNSGAADFDFVVLDEDWTAPLLPTVPYTSCGAADAFGYTCLDSNVPDSPVTYDWVDISATGTSLGLSGANDFYWPLQLPFTFSYYGQDYNELAIHSYGQVYFEDRQPDPYFGGNQPIPQAVPDGVETFIAPLWDNLNYTEASKSYYEVQGVAPHRRVVIQWEGIESSQWPPQVMDFQVILFENGNILTQYKSLGGSTGYQATIGIQGDAQTGLQYGYNEPVLADELAVCFVHPHARNKDCALQPPDAPWLAAAPASGTVQANSSQTVEVALTATAIDPGLYTGAVYLGGTDNDPLVIPVTMRVVNLALTAVPPTQMVLPQQTAQYTVTLTNMGAVTDTFSLTIDANWDTRLLLPGRTPQADLGLTLAPGETVTFGVLVTPPADAWGGTDTAVIQATSQTYAESYSAVNTVTTVQQAIFLPLIFRN